MGKNNLIGNTSLSIKNAPISRKKPEPENSREKLGLLTKETAKLRTYRLKLETIEALDELKKNINKIVNITITATDIIELLILDASRGDVNRVINLIRNTDQG